MAALGISILAKQLRKAGEDAAAAASADSAASGGGAGPSTSARGARCQAPPPPEFHIGLRERKPVDYNVTLETGEMLAPEEAPSLLPAGDAPAAAAAAAAPSAKRPRVPDGGASAPKRRRHEGEQRCSNPTCPRPEHTSRGWWRSSRDGSGGVLCQLCYQRQVGSRSRPRPFHMRTRFAIPSSDCLVFRFSLPLRRSRRRGSPRAASAPGWSRPSGAAPGRTPTSSCATPATKRRCVPSPRPTGSRCPLRARSMTNDPSLPSFPSQLLHPGCTCASCGAAETSYWRTASTGEHAGKPVCNACHLREKRRR